MSYLGLNCSVEKGLGRLIIIIIDNDSNVIRHVFRSPSVFSFKHNSAEILNWHRDNIISLISQYKVEGLAVKKTERTAFQSKPKNSDIFKLYMEGLMLSLAGSIGKFNKHFYKTNIQMILKNGKIFEETIPSICKQYELADITGIATAEIEPTKDTLLATLALKTIMS